MTASQPSSQPSSLHPRASSFLPRKLAVVLCRRVEGSGLTWGWFAGSFLGGAFLYEEMAGFQVHAHPPVRLFGCMCVLAFV